MAYFDTDKTAAPATDTGADFYRLVKSIFATLIQALPHTTKSPEDIVAAQHRAEAARRKVDTLLR